MMRTATKISQLISLPPIPRIARELLQIVDNDKTTITHIAESIDREPGFTAKIVGMANSAFFPGRATVCSVEQAIVKIGLNRVKNIVLGILLLGYFDPERCPLFKIDRYWSDAMAAGHYASNLVATTRVQASRDSAHLCGLLHNLGLLILSHVAPEAMTVVFQKKAAAPDSSLAKIENAELGIDHYLAAELLCEHWGLPEETVVAVRYCGDPGYRGEYSDLVALVRFCVAWKKREYNILPDAEDFPLLILDAEALEKIGNDAVEVREQIARFAAQLI